MNTKLYNLEGEELKLAGGHPDLIAGAAVNLEGKVERTNDSMYRTCANDEDIQFGTAEVMAVRGEARAWNQLAPMITEDNYMVFNESYSQITEIRDGVCSVKVIDGYDSNTPSRYIYCPKYKQSLKTIEGHKYLSYVDLYISVAQTRAGIELNSQAALFQNSIPANKWTRCGVIDTANRSFTTLLLHLGHFTEENNTYSVKNLMLFDLTLIYGAGNEPTTPEQFEADYQRWFGKPLTYEEYDEGSIRNVKAEGVKTVGFNLAPITEYEGTMINLYAQYGRDDKRFWVNNCGYKGQMHIYAEVETKLDNTRPNLKVFYTDGTSKGFSAGTTTKGIMSGVTDNTKVISHISVAYNANASDNIKLSNICINFSWSGKRDGDYEPHWEETKSLPITTLRGKLNGEGGSVVVFPDGMKKAGDVYDEIKVEGGVVKAIKRVGSVDLGSLSWTKLGDSARFRALLVGLAPVESTNNVINALVSKRYKVTSQNMLNGSSGYYLSYYDATTTNLLIKDIDYFNAETLEHNVEGLKASLQGTILYYELAEYEEYIIDNFELPLAYKVDDFGTEEIVSPENTIAPILTTKYGLNAVDAIRNLPNKYARKDETYTKQEVDDKLDNPEGVISARCVEVDEIQFTDEHGTVITGETFNDIEHKLRGVTKVADDSEVIKEINLDLGNEIKQITKDTLVGIRGEKGIELTDSGDSKYMKFTFTADTNYLATKEGLNTLDKSLSNAVLGEEVIDEQTFPEIEVLTREELKKDLFINMWETYSPCCSYNRATNYFEIDYGDGYKLDDLTLKDALLIYRYGSWENRESIINIGVSSLTANPIVPQIRGTIPSIRIWENSINFVIGWTIRALEIVKYSYSNENVNPVIHISNSRLTIYGYSKHWLDWWIPDNSIKIENSKAQGGKVETFYIYKVTKNITIDMPSLSLKSVKFMVDNAANTAPITATMENGLYLALTSNAESYPYNGGTREEWQAVNTLALSKQITFATV